MPKSQAKIKKSAGRSRSSSHTTTTGLVDGVFSARRTGVKYSNKSKTEEKSNRANKRKSDEPLVEWLKYSNSVRVKSGERFYKFARVGDLYINEGDNVVLPSPDKDGCLPQIAQVAYMFESADRNKMFHAHYYWRGTETVLGDKSHTNELFFVDNCEDVFLASIIDKAKVGRKKYPENWNEIGGIDRGDFNDSDDGMNYCSSKRFIYENSRFVDYFKEPGAQCMSCFWQKKANDLDVATHQYYDESVGQSYVKWRNDKYFVGSGVFIDYERETVKKTKKEESVEHTDIVLLNSDNTPFKPEDTPSEPFTVGVIEKILKNGSIKIREFYRVEDTGAGYGHPSMVYWTNNIYSIDNMDKWKEKIKGKCFVRNKGTISNVDQWLIEGPFRFYYDKVYNPKKKVFENLPLAAQNYGSRSRNICSGFIDTEQPPTWPEITTKLMCMDIYAGCGGLSDGLKRSGLIEVNWAIDYDELACQSFKLNNPGAVVINQDCNDVLYKLLNGDKNNLHLPGKDDVDIIVGGPPCQGFSTINRFKSAESAKRNNSQISTYLGFIDYYRPKYFVFENIKSFATLEKGAIFRATLKCLLDMGYQIAFGILQAGKYGLPQSRRRIFLVGAAPGLVLPNLPEPTHCFGSFEKRVDSIYIDKLPYDFGEFSPGEFGSLPYRRVTVRDAIYDLPPVNYDSMQSETPYNTQTLDSSFYAKYCRMSIKNREILKDHESPNIRPKMKEIIEKIPLGGDLRDLETDPTEDESVDANEIYGFLETTRACVKNRLLNEKKKRKCSSLVPRRGKYGRLTWDGVFETVTTNPEPNATQGKVLHPDQHRVITVRECARAQGFHDEYQFTGSVRNKYRQIGNAVPPILATAIGRQIVKVLTVRKY